MVKGKTSSLSTNLVKTLFSIPISRTEYGLAVQGALFLTLIAIVLHILDRQGDLVARTDFLWKAKLKVEQEEVETMRGINKVRNGLCAISIIINPMGYDTF